MIELMFVVAIIGLIAAVAIPAFRQYMFRAKTAETGISLKLIADGLRVYFDSEHANGANHFLPADIPLTPNAVASGSKNKIATTVGQFKSSPGWLAIGFYPASDYYYSYSFNSSCLDQQCGEGAVGFIYAMGDLDGDGNLSTFYKRLKVDGGTLNGEPIFVFDELE